MFSPIEGRRHNSFMLGEYAAYGLPNNIVAPFRGAAAEKEFDHAMGELCICIEWGFGKIAQYWAFLDFKKNLNILLQPVAKYYIVGSLLINCHTCLSSSVTGTYFNLEPPSLKRYISNACINPTIL